MALNGVIPAGTVEPAPYGLFSVADVDEKGPRDSHWGQGFSAMSEACAFDAEIVDICGGIESVQVFTKDGERFQDVRPFGIVAFDRCLSVGFDAEDRKARVIRQLETVSQKAVETELWSGTYGSAWNTSQAGNANAVKSMYLSNSDATTVVGDATALKPKVALAVLEQALAACSPGTEGVIHMSPLVGSILGDHLNADDDGKLRTTTGNLVAIGSGYDGRGPGDTAAPSDPFVHWMYATGKVYVVLGSEEAITVNDAEAINTKTNEMTYAAERPAAVYTDGCCQLAVKTDIRL